jgi:hypothetical protein
VLSTRTLWSRPRAAFSGMPMCGRGFAAAVETHSTVLGVASAIKSQMTDAQYDADASNGGVGATNAWSPPD